MKLKKFKQRDPKKIGITIFTGICVLLIAGVFFYTSFASFETHDEFNIIEGTVQSNGDLYFAFYVDDEISKTMPQKGEGYVIDKEKTTCTKGASIDFNEAEWSVKVLNMTERNTKCTLYFESRYSEEVLNGAYPVLKEPLIPVTIESDGTVKKADLKSEWYSYEKKNWANAVILIDEKETYEDGAIIPEEKIESYFVWIPKYRYQLWDLGEYETLTSIDTSKVHEIPIIFGDYTTLDEREGECTTPMESGATGNCTVGDYMTHPSFLSIPSTGFWVGKFSTTFQNTSKDINDPENISIKPNQNVWRTGNMSNSYLNSHNYQRDLDSHMMKNTEWGAVAYLSYSKYGVHQKIRLNNNSSYITGYQANNEPTCGYTGTNEECNRYCDDESCNTAYPNSTLASTTGNISGIYDMVGHKTAVMAFMQYSDGTITVGKSIDKQSGFNGTLGDGSLMTTGVDLPSERYYDVYEYSSDIYNTVFSRRILGDATGEIGPFESYTENAVMSIASWNNAFLNQFFSENYSIGARGYFYFGGYLSDIFSFQGMPGTDVIPFRLILTPTK